MLARYSAYDLRLPPARGTRWFDFLFLRVYGNIRPLNWKKLFQQKIHWLQEAYFIIIISIFRQSREMKRYSFLPPRAPSPAQAFVWNAQVNQALFILWHHWHRIASSLASELSGSRVLIAGMDTGPVSPGQSKAQCKYFSSKWKKLSRNFWRR